MSEPLKIILKNTLLSSPKFLTIDAELLSFGNESFSNFEIAEIRYGVKAIRGYKIRIGRIYCIDIKSVTGKIIKIRLTSVYLVRRRKLEEKYKQILTSIFEHYINGITQNLIELFNDKIDIEILGVVFVEEGIILGKSQPTIKWSDLGTKDYWTYYALFSKSNANANKSFYYLTDWNTCVLYSVSRYILNTKSLLKT